MFCMDYKVHMHVAMDMAAYIVRGVSIIISENWQGTLIA